MILLILFCTSSLFLNLLQLVDPTGELSVDTLEPAGDSDVSSKDGHESSGHLAEVTPSAAAHVPSDTSSNSSGSPDMLGDSDTRKVSHTDLLKAFMSSILVVVCNT